MDIPVSRRTDAILSLTLLALLLGVAGHVCLPELVAWVQWLIAEVIEPMLGLDELVWK
jgi:hypothetical protein